MNTDYKKYFKDKKITVMGLGVLGRGVNVVKFLAQQGADLIVTDLKSKADLKISLDVLRKFENIKYVLGKHRLADFKDRDMVIKAAGVPYDSIYIKEARKNRIAVEMDASLMARLNPATVIGITGTRGKSTVTNLIYQGLKQVKRRVFLGGNIRGVANLPLLNKLKKGDLVVLELDSWQLQGFGDSKISPHIAVFTNFMRDHMNYYRKSMVRYFNDKANIFKYQGKDDCLIVSRQAKQEINRRHKGKIQSRVIKAQRVPRAWQVKLIGQHNLDNIALAVSALKALKIKLTDIRKAMENYAGEPGRLEFIREHKGIKYLNDTNSTTPDAVIAALKALKNNIVLIAGGADKELKYNNMVKEINKRVKSLVLIKGVSSDKINALLDEKIEPVGSMKEAIAKARAKAEKGDIILLSPGAASFGVFKNEYDRGDQFNKIVKGLK